MSSIIPTHLLERLVLYKPALEVSGAVLCRREKGRHTSYRIRFRAESEDLGYRKQWAIPLGKDADVAKAVSRLLTHWQTEHQHESLRKYQEKQALRDAERAIRRAQRQELREERVAIKLLAGGSKTRQRRMAKEWDEVRQLGPLESSLWLMSKQYSRPNQPGRKRDRQRETRHLGIWAPVDVQTEVRNRMSERRTRVSSADNAEVHEMIAPTESLNI